MVKRALAIVTLALCALTPGALLVAAPPASAAVDKEISWALDFLYARQRADGGFSLSGTTGSAFETPYAMYAVTAGDQALSKWKAGGKTPVAYLQSLDLEATALATSPRNPPVFYAKCILAYRAAGRRDLIYYAGNKGIDLVTKMNAYRNASLGYYASQAGGGGLYEISTTAWAMLALSAANETDDGKITDAAQWLRTVDAAGGYPVEPGEPEEVDATAIAILALRAADDVSSSAANTARIASALAFVKGCQKTSGGFTDRPGGDTANTAATGWAVQAIRAAGESPGDVTTGAAGAKTPLEFLRNAQLASGAFGLTLASGRTTLATTSLGTIGLRSGAYLPVKGDGNPASPNFRPYFVKNSVKPANGAVFTTSTVTVAAAYADTARGTGIKISAIRVTVDGTNKTKPASISKSRLSLKLVNLSSGTHSVVIRIADKAGNARSTTRSFTVRVATPSTPTPTPTQTYRPPTTPTYRPPTTTTPPTVITPTPTPPYSGSPDPYDTLSPYPYDSVYPYDDGYPYSSSPSPSGSSALGAPGEGGGTGSWPMTALAILLVTLVPIGALASYIRRQRLAASLGAAPQGKVLPGGGSAWQRLKGRFTRGGSAPATGE